MAQQAMTYAQMGQDGEGKPDESSDEEDPSIAERAQYACIRLVVGCVLGVVGAGILVYPVHKLEEKGGDFGGSHTQAAVFGLGLLGCIFCSVGSFCCLAPIADSVDAITDMCPCLPSCLEELIDGMADAVVGAIACLLGTFCTLLILGVALLVYFPMYGGICLAICVVLAILICVGCSQAKDAPSALKVVSKEYYHGFSGIYTKEDGDDGPFWTKEDGTVTIKSNEDGVYVFSPEYVKSSEPHEGRYPYKVSWQAWDQEQGDWVDYESLSIKKCAPP